MADLTSALPLHRMRDPPILGAICGHGSAMLAPAAVFVENPPPAPRTKAYRLQSVFVVTGSTIVIFALPIEAWRIGAILLWVSALLLLVPRRISVSDKSNGRDKRNDTGDHLHRSRSKWPSLA